MVLKISKKFFFWLFIAFQFLFMFSPAQQTSDFSQQVRNLLITRAGRTVLAFFEKNPYNSSLDITKEEYHYLLGLANLVTYRQTDRSDTQFINNAEQALLIAKDIQNDPNLQVRIYMYLSAIYLLEKNNQSEAEKYLTSSEKLISPDEPIFVTFCFWKLYMGNIPPEEENYYRNVISKFPPDSQVLDYRTTQFVNAETIFREIKKRESVAEIHALYLPNIQNETFTLRTMKRDIEKNMDQVIRNLDLAVVAIAQERYESAHTLAIKAQYVQETHVGHHLLGRCFAYYGDYKKAEQHYEKSQKISEDYAQNWYWMGKLNLEVLSNFSRAEKYLKTAVSLEPGKGAFRQLYGRALLANGKYAEASAEFKKAVEYMPDNAEAVRDLAWFTDVYETNYSEARALYKKYISLAPDSIDAQFVRNRFNAIKHTASGGGK